MLKGILMEPFSKSEWLIARPILSGLADYLSSEGKLIAELEAIRFKPVKVHKDNKTIALPLEHPMDPRIQKVFLDADQMLRNYSQSIVADCILKCYHNDRKQTLEYVKALLNELKPQEAKGTAVEDLQPDNEPIPPDSFYWEGRSYRGLSPQPWRLLHALWTARNRTRKIDSNLGNDVWQDHALLPDKEQIGTASKAIKAFFKNEGIPLRVTTKGEYVSLVDSPRKIPANSP
jgi:hypothetical protein